MDVLTNLRRRGRTVASVSTVSVFSTGIVVLALTNPGLSTTDVLLNDSGVWVTRSQDNTVGRFNASVETVDGAVTAATASYDVLQAADAVLVHHADQDTISPVDVAGLVMTGTAQLPEGADVAMGGRTVAVLDPRGGLLWVMPFDALSSFSAEGTEPVAELPRGVEMAVGIDGTVHAVGGDRLLTVPLTDAGLPGEPLEEPLGVGDADTQLAITAVGPDAVVLDRAGDRIRLPGGSWQPVPDAAGAVLQEPGPSSDTVVLAMASALVSQRLDGSAAEELSVAGGGEPAAPVRLGRCAYGAWSGSGAVARDCAGEADDQSKVLPGDFAGARLQYRVNRDVIVLNEVAEGTVWLADRDFERIDDAFSDVMAQRSGENEPDPTTEVSNQPFQPRDQANRPPVADDDDLGVRPGRTTVLRLLENDRDPDGDVLTINVSKPDVKVGSVQVIHGGAAVQLAVPDDATGDTASFDYAVDDGRGGTDTATVTVTVRSWEDNVAPVQLRQTTMGLEQGKAADVAVLHDWMDPDGDDLTLVDATSTSEADTVRSRADGLVTFQDAGTSQGSKAVRLTVSDGQANVEGDLVVDVRPTAEQAPETRPDHVTTTVGRPVTVEPLLNDFDPNGDVLRLVRVDEGAPGVVTPDFEARTFSFVSDIARTYYLTYSVSDGPKATAGLVRIDVLPEPDDTAAPVAVRDTALLPAGGEVLVDVLANDVDPAGGVLVVQSVDVPAVSGVSVELVEHRLLRVRDVQGLTGSVTVGYTVSNGAASTAGEVSVLPMPAAATLRPPVAVDDEVTVRAGDVVTIPVLANDSHPDGAPLSLVAELVEQPDPGSGLIFTTQEDTVRFQAGPAADPVYAVYEITDAQGQKDSARITILVRPTGAEGNSAPRPREVTARVLAGSTVRIPVPLEGIDPDGDSVTLLGLDEAPVKGRVSDFGQGWLQYEANGEATGVDTLTYAVEDPYGARATGTVLVGIAPPPQVNQPPRAVDDAVVVRPGRVLAVAVMSNDVDPDGDRIQLVERLDAQGVEARVELDRILMDVPLEPGLYTIYYTIQDVFGERSTAALAVDVRDDAPLLPPIARDDALTLSDVVGRRAVDVPVLENDEDPDGSGAELDVSTPSERATVLADRRLRVVLMDTTQVLPYTVTDPDGLTATAFLRVPGLGSLRPTLRADAGAEVLSGQTLTVQVDDVVVVADGRTPRITEAGRVKALRGTAAVVDETTLTYVSDPSYSGPAALTFEVTDGTGPEDSTGRKAVLTLPITVVPSDNEPPTFAGAGVSVAPGEEASADLTRYATDRDPGDAGRLRFSVTGDQPTGMRVSIDGSVLRVSVDRSVLKGTVETVALAVTDGVTEQVPGSVTITVVPATEPLAAAADDIVTDAQQGRTTVVRVLANDSNPFPETPLRVVSATVESSTTGTAVVQGADVAVTPADDFVGTMVVRYSVEDATRDPDRRVEGRVLVTVQGRPDAPTTPAVVEVRNKTVVLSWAPPGNNGSVITGYTVTSPQGYTRQCAATTCTLEGLTNDVEYTFTVIATNAVGPSDASPPSAPARPDERPDPPDAPTLRFGDQSLTVSWTNTSYTDRSPIQSVTLEISPAPPSGSLQLVQVTGTSVTWDGLENGVPYRVRVQAVNRAPTPSEWSPYSAAEIPAGVPGVPGTPTTQALAPVGNQAQLQVSWPAAAPNGDPVSEYVLTVVRGGAVVRALPVPGTQTTQAVTVDASQDNYTFSVVATNKAGTSAASPASAPRRAVLAPGPVKALSAAPGDNAVQLSFGPADGNGARPGEIRYQYQVNGGGWSNLRANNRVTSGVPNNGTYTVGVRAVSTVDGADYNGPPTNANPVAPFGEPGRPTARAVGRERDVVLSWAAPARNGRDVRMQISVDGGGWQPVASSGSITVGDDYEQEHSIRVQAVDSEGRQTEASASARSANRPPPPQAKASTVKGRDAQGMLGCSDSSCRYLEVRVENWPTETGRVSCQERVNGSWREFHSPINPDTFSGTETEEVNCWYGKTGFEVRVVLPNGAIATSTQW